MIPLVGKRETKEPSPAPNLLLPLRREGSGLVSNSGEDAGPARDSYRSGVEGSTPGEERRERVLEIGKAYYLVAHAYYHFIGIVTEVYGPNRVKLGRCVRVLASTYGRDWQKFFEAGCHRPETEYSVLPEGKVVIFFDATPWHHEVPTS